MAGTRFAVKDSPDDVVSKVNEYLKDKKGHDIFDISFGEDQLKQKIIVAFVHKFKTGSHIWKLNVSETFGTLDFQHNKRTGIFTIKGQTVYFGFSKG